MPLPSVNRSDAPTATDSQQSLTDKAQQTIISLEDMVRNSTFTLQGTIPNDALNRFRKNITEISKLANEHICRTYPNNQHTRWSVTRASDEPGTMDYRIDCRLLDDKGTIRTLTWSAGLYDKTGQQRSADTVLRFAHIKLSRYGVKSTGGLGFLSPEAISNMEQNLLAEAESSFSRGLRVTRINVSLLKGPSGECKCIASVQLACGEMRDFGTFAPWLNSATGEVTSLPERWEVIKPIHPGWDWDQARPS
jgi:hypothetical protein